MRNKFCPRNESFSVVRSPLASCARENPSCNTLTLAHFSRKGFLAPRQITSGERFYFGLRGTCRPLNQHPRSPRPLGGLVIPFYLECTLMLHQYRRVFTIGSFGPCWDFHTWPIGTRARQNALTQDFLNKTLFATSVSRRNLETDWKEGGRRDKIWRSKCSVTRIQFTIKDIYALILLLIVQLKRCHEIEINWIGTRSRSLRPT